MITKEIIDILAATLGISALILIIGFILIILYPSLKLLFSDIIRPFGFVAKRIRKTIVESEIEGSFDYFSKKFNDDFINPILAPCKIQWVDEKNQEIILNDGKPIICLSFSKKNHDLNYYNAAVNFIKTSLLYRTKPFLYENTKNAIDLLMTKNLLSDSRRSAITIFNDKFNNIEQTCKELFIKFEETDKKGLFKRILLQELYYFGELLV